MYEPKKQPRNDLGIQCPFKFNLESAGFKADCIQEKCALWMHMQRACAFNVLARRNKNE